MHLQNLQETLSIDPLRPSCGHNLVFDSHCTSLKHIKTPEFLFANANLNDERIKDGLFNHLECKIDWLQLIKHSIPMALSSQQRPTTKPLRHVDPFGHGFRSSQSDEPSGLVEGGVFAGHIRKSTGIPLSIMKQVKLKSTSSQDALGIHFMWQSELDSKLFVLPPHPVNLNGRHVNVSTSRWY